MILNKYFLEENTLYQHTPLHQTTHQHITPNTHTGTLRTCWVCPETTSVFVSQSPTPDVDAFGMWQTVKISSNHFTLRRSPHIIVSTGAQL